MAPLRSFLLGLSSVSSFVVASPIKEDAVVRAARPNLLCSIENPIVQLLGAERPATSFCSCYLDIPTATFYASTTTTTSTSTTLTITTGTEVDTVATSTLTETSTTTTTLVTYTTSDDTAPTPVKRALRVTAIPDPLAHLEAAFLSSACSCLSIPAASTTITKTATSTVSLISTTSTFASTTTFTPVFDTSTTATETATSTSVILKSDVLTSIAAIVSQDSYQSFCSNILGYTTPLTTVYQTVISTAFETESVTTTETDVVATLTTTIIGAKRQVDLKATPAPLASYPADYVTSGCLLAVTSPATSTISNTISETTTETTVETATQVVQETATATTTLVKYPLVNGDFEFGNFTPWVGQVDTAEGGSWTIEPSSDPGHGSFVAQAVIPSGVFYAWLTQHFTAYPGHTYTLTFDYMCGQVSSDAWVHPQLNPQPSPQPFFYCDVANTWSQGSVTWTPASTADGYVQIVFGIQDYKEEVFWVDNIIVTLNN